MIRQFRLVKRGPSTDKFHGTCRKATSQDADRVDLDKSFVLALGSMEVRGPVLFVIHLDYDPVEFRDP
jgi:hypothetical protein